MSSTNEQTNLPQPTTNRSCAADCNNTRDTKENHLQHHYLDQLDTLPRTVLDQILLHLARMDYDSVLTLAKTSRSMQTKCHNFIHRHPRSLFRRPGGMSDSEGSYDGDPFYGGDNDDDDDDRFYDFDPDNIEDYLDRLSFGSNYDEELYEHHLAQGGGRDFPEFIPGARHGEEVVNAPEQAGNHAEAPVDWDEEW